MLLLRNMFVAIATMALLAFSAPSAMAGKATDNPLEYASQCSNEIRVVYDAGTKELQAIVDKARAKIDAQYAMDAPRSEMIRTAGRCIAALEESSGKYATKLQRMINRAVVKLDKAGASLDIIGIVSKHEINVHHMGDEVLDQAIAQIVEHLSSIIHQPTQNQ